MARSATSAELLQTLVWFDGPQLAWFKTNRGLNMLGVAVGEPDLENRFFACEMSDKVFRAYQYGRADLRYVFRYAAHRSLFFFSWSQMEGSRVRLIRASKEEIADPALYPESGFFSDDHTEEWATPTLPTAKRRSGLRETSRNFVSRYGSNAPRSGCSGSSWQIQDVACSKRCY